MSLTLMQWLGLGLVRRTPRPTAGLDHSRFGQRRQSRLARRRRLQPKLESLESIVVMSTYNIISPADSGAGTLRAEAQAAFNANDHAAIFDLKTDVDETSGQILLPDGSTVEGFSTATIRSTSTAPALGAAGTSNSYVIRNTNFTGTAGPAFTVYAGANVSFSNDTFTDCATSSAPGTGALNLLGDSSIDKSLFQNNPNEAIVQTGSLALLVTNSTFKNNSSTNPVQGSCITFDMPSNAVDTIANNKFSNNSGVAPVFVGSTGSGANLTINLNTITGNTGGVGAFWGGGVTILSSDTITSNARSTAGNQVVNTGQNFFGLEYDTFQNDTELQGGAVVKSYGSTTTQNLQEDFLYDNTFAGCVAGNSTSSAPTNGIVCLVEGANRILHVENNTLAGNTVYGNGGFNVEPLSRQVPLSSNMHFWSNTIEGNQALENPNGGGYGAGLFNGTSVPLGVDNCAFGGNIATVTASNDAYGALSVSYTVVSELVSGGWYGSTNHITIATLSFAGVGIYNGGGHTGALLTTPINGPSNTFYVDPREVGFMDGLGHFRAGTDLVGANSQFA